MPADVGNRVDEAIQAVQVAAQAVSVERPVHVVADAAVLEFLGEVPFPQGHSAFIGTFQVIVQVGEKHFGTGRAHGLEAFGVGQEET
ncbi:hypothetical protein D9M68_919580 [compost metagenome]